MVENDLFGTLWWLSIVTKSLLNFSPNLWFIQRVAISLSHTHSSRDTFYLDHSSVLGYGIVSVSFLSRQLSEKSSLICQRLAGVSSLNVWLAHFVWDVLIFSIQMMLCMVRTNKHSFDGFEANLCHRKVSWRSFNVTRCS